MKFWPGLIALLLGCGWACGRYSSLDQNIARAFEVNDNLLADYQQGFAVLDHFLQNIDSIKRNEDLMNPDFLSGLNQFFERFVDRQAEVYSKLKLMLTEMDYVVRNLGSFDLLLAEDFRGLIEFLAALQMSDDDDTQLNTIFSNFIGSKNVMHFLYKNIFQNVRDLTTTVINIFDVNETFEKEATGGEAGQFGFDVSDLTNYHYLIGYVKKMRDLNDDFAKVQEKLILNKISWEQSVIKFDDSLDLLKTFYHRIYVQGVDPSAAVIPVNDEDALKILNDGTGEFNETVENEENASPTNICDQNVGNNFGIKVLEKAEEVSEFEPLEECKGIRMSCCAKSDLKKAFSVYQNNHLLTLKQKYLFVFKTLKLLLKNYETYNKRAYDTLRVRGAEEVCVAAARKVVFFPISRVYISNFNGYMSKAFEFATKSRNGLLCSVCDFDFHKTILESRSVYFSNNFCSSMMSSTYDFSKNFYVQLMDYFENVSTVYQCDQQSGVYRSEIALNFEVPEFVKEVFAKCDAGSEGFCLDYCQEFSFGSMTSIFDVDHVLIRDLYHFLEQKLKEDGESLGQAIPNALVFTASNEYEIQLNKAVLDIDSVDYQFIKASEETGQNPSFEGAPIPGIETFFN